MTMIPVPIWRSLDICGELLPVFERERGKQYSLSICGDIPVFVKKRCLCYPHQSGMQADNLIIIHITLTKRCSNAHITQGKLDQIGLQCFPLDTERERRFPGENNVG